MLLTVTHQPEPASPSGDGHHSPSTAKPHSPPLAAIAAINLDTTAAAGTLAAITAWEALLFSTVATLNTTKPEAVVYRWVGAVFWVAAYVFFVVWSGWSPETVTAVTITLGAVVSGIALAAHLLAPTHRITEMWLWPIAAVGQTALVGAGLYAGDMLTNTDTLLAGTALAAIEAALVATYATVRLDQTAAWISTALGTAALGLLAGALQADPIDLLRVTGPIGAALLAAWVILAVTQQRARLELWRWPSLALAQAALATTAAIAAINLDTTAAAGTLAAITAWEALLFSTVATLNTTKPEAVISLGFGLGSYAAFLRWLELDGMLSANAWLGLTLFLLIAATLASRRSESQRADVWSWPLHGAAATAAVLTVVSAAAYLAGADARFVTSAVIAVAGIHVLVNRALFEPYVPVDTGAALAVVAAGALATTALDPTESWTFAVLLTMALDRGGGAVGHWAPGRATYPTGNHPGRRLQHHPGCRCGCFLGSALVRGGLPAHRERRGTRRIRGCCPPPRGPGSGSSSLAGGDADPDQRSLRSGIARDDCPGGCRAPRCARRRALSASPKGFDST